MNFIKRAFISVKKRFSKNILLLAVFLIVANLVIAGLSIKTATDKAADLARQKLGSSVTLSFDMMSQMQGNRTPGEKVTIERESLTTSMADELAAIEYVVAYNYLVSSTANATDFEAVEIDTGGTNTTQGPTIDWGNSGNGGPGGRGEGSMPSIQFNSGDLSIQGVVSVSYLDEFTSGKYVLNDGEYITAEDSESDYVMIEATLASQNNLSVGDTIEIESVDGSVSKALTIKGIYEIVDNDTLSTIGFSRENPQNTIYTSYKTAGGMDTNYTDGEISSAIYYLDDPENIDAFKAEAESAAIDFTKFTLDADDSAYEQMMGPIENVASFSNITVIVTVIAGVVIITLLLVLSLKSRNYEIGVLLAIGESKLKIISQLLVETLMIAGIAIVISSASGNIISQKVGDVLLENEISSNEATTETGFGNMQGMPTGATGMSMGGRYFENVDVIDEIDVSVTASDFGLLVIVGFAVVGISTLFPAAFVMRLKPREILTRKE